MIGLVGVVWVGLGLYVFTYQLLRRAVARCVVQCDTRSRFELRRHAVAIESSSKPDTVKCRMLNFNIRQICRMLNFNIRHPCRMLKFNIRQNLLLVLLIQSVVSPLSYVEFQHTTHLSYVEFQHTTSMSCQAAAAVNGLIVAQRCGIWQRNGCVNVLVDGGRSLVTAGHSATPEARCDDVPPSRCAG